MPEHMRVIDMQEPDAAKSGLLERLRQRRRARRQQAAEHARVRREQNLPSSARGHGGKKGPGAGGGYAGGN
jgi:hypothetical protein